MASSVKSSIYCPSKFDGLNFPLWKIKMIIFLQFLGSRVAKTISKLFVCPKGDEESQSKITVKKYEANSKAHYALLQALNYDDISRVINCTSSFDIWQVLITTHEGTTKVKKAKFDLLISQLKIFICFMVNLLMRCLLGLLLLLMNLFL